MKKLKRILLDDFEQLSEAEAAQCVGGMGLSSILIDAIPLGTHPFGWDTTNIMPLGGGPGNSGTFSGNTSNNGNGTYNGSIYYNSGNIGLGIGYNGKNGSWTYSGSYKYESFNFGASYNSINGMTYSGGYKQDGFNFGASYNSSSGWTYKGGYKNGNVSGEFTYNSSSGWGGFVKYTYTF